MKTAKFLLVFAACAVLYRVFEPVYQAETPYSRSEFEQVSSFLLYKRQHLEAYVRYCAQQNYRLEKMPAAFEQQHARQIKRRMILSSVFSRRNAGHFMRS